MSRPSGLDRFFHQAPIGYYLRERLLKPEWAYPAGAPQFQRALGDYLLGEDADILTQAMYFETAATLTGDMLVKADRISMANSFEARAPLRDPNLAELP